MMGGVRWLYVNASPKDHWSPSKDRQHHKSNHKLCTPHKFTGQFTRSASSPQAKPKTVNRMQRELSGRSQYDTEYDTAIKAPFATDLIITGTCGGPQKNYTGFGKSTTCCHGTVSQCMHA